MAYWDTSCLVKLYVSESDSGTFSSHVSNGATVVTSVIARLELWATLRRKEAAGDLLPTGARHALASYDADVAAGLIVVESLSNAVVTSFEATIERAYAVTPPIPLRTLDAIHLATASVSGETEVIATDQRLRDAALRIGLAVFPPP